MIEDLKNKVVLITGASTGIGAGAARAFGANGAKVAIHYNKSKAEAEKVAAAVEKAGGKAMLVAGDVTDSAICRQIVDKTAAGFGRIDVLINNAGGLIERAPIESITDELFDKVVYLNVRSAMICSGAAAQHMRKQGSGGARCDHDAVPRALLHAADARGLQGHHPDEPAWHRRRMRRRLSVPCIRTDVGIHDRADPGSQRRAVHAVARCATACVTA